MSSGKSGAGRIGALTLGALGVVFGDIGTSPLYAFKEAFVGAHPLPVSDTNIYGVLSLIFWSVMLIVSLKYVAFVLRFDNKGEGGVLALLAFAQRLFRANPRLQWAVGVMAVFAASP
jgi:KUP system potassium uptake protein